MEDISRVKVTIFKDINDIGNPHEITIEKALERIEAGDSMEKVKAVRNSTSSEEKTEAKKQLPCVLFSGAFSNPQKNKKGNTTYREKDCLTKHSGLVALDYDDVEPMSIMEELCADNYILAAWVSPSGNGVKALVRIEDSERHEAHYNAVISHFSKYGELDTSSRNVNRVTYESWDADIHINWQAWIFSNVLEEERKKATNSVGGLISTYDYAKVKVPVAMIRNSKVGERNNTLVKSATLAGGYIQGGYVPRDIFENILQVEYQQVNPDEGLDDTVRAIHNGIEHGLTMPIYDFEREEKKAIEQYGENPYAYLEDKDKESLRLYKWYLGERDETWSTGWSELDNFMPWKHPQLHVHVGHDTVGKTFNGAYFMVQAAVMHGWHGAILAIENQTWAMIRDMMSFAAGKRVMNMSRREFVFYKDFITSHFEFVSPDSYTVHECLDMFDGIIGKKSIRNIMIDPYNSLARVGNSAYAHDVDAGAKLLLFTRSRNVNIWLNVHTTSYARRTTHEEGSEYAGLVKMPNKGDVEMGSVWQNKADYFTIGHRYIKHENPRERATTLLSVEKVKDKETGGSIHPYDESFKMRLEGGTFVNAHGERGFEPLKMPNKKEV